MKTRLAYIAIVAAWTTLPCASLRAQVRLDALRHCATLDDDAERVQCFDRAMSFDESPEPGAAETSASQSAPEPAPAPELARVSTVPPSARPASPPPESAATPVRETVAARDLRGDGSNPPPAALPTDRIKVVDVIENPARPIVFETEDGSLWTKTSRGIQRYPDPPFPATIERRRFGSVWLVLADGLSVRVTRSE